MKVKVKKSFISGLYTGKPGDEIDVPDRLAAKLMKIDVVKPAARGEPKEDTADAPRASESPVKAKNGDPPASKRKTTKTKTAAKTGE